MSVKIPLILFSSLLLCLLACGPGSDSVKKPKYLVNKDSLKKQFIEANQALLQKENDEMDYYASAHQMPFKKTKSGIRYYVYQPSAKGDSIRDTSVINLDFKVSLLNGKECYASKAGEPNTVRVDRLELESGIHMALLYLKRGDKALVLIPSHLAHGLLGDFRKIPPQMPIVYDISVN